MLPSRLRHRVSVLQNATVPLTRGDGATIDPQTLTVMASAVTGRERLRFAYRAGDGAETRRQVEPYRLVSTGWRWYLVAYDLEREAWRTFRVDRVSDPYPTGSRFTPRELPTGDAAEFLSSSMARIKPELAIDVSFAAPAEFVASRLPASIGPLEPTGEHSCRLRATLSGSLEWVAVRLAMVDCEFTAHGPSQLLTYLNDLGGRLTRAAGQSAAPSAERSAAQGG